MLSFAFDFCFQGESIYALSLPSCPCVHEGGGRAGRGTPARLDPIVYNLSPKAQQATEAKIFMADDRPFVYGAR